jgi:hypothetical protein
MAKEKTYRVEKRYLNTATIMFLSSDSADRDQEEIAADFAARLEELTEEIVSLSVEVYPLNGGRALGKQSSITGRAAAPIAVSTRTRSIMSCQGTKAGSQ